MYIYKKFTNKNKKETRKNFLLKKLAKIEIMSTFNQQSATFRKYYRSFIYSLDCPLLYSNDELVIITVVLDAIQLIIIQKHLQKNIFISCF